MIELRDLSVYVGGFSLSGINFYVPAGSYGVLMGKTGSGKTTLLESICGLRQHVSGKILLDDHDVTRLKPAQRGIGLVPQDGALFSRMTVAEHLSFPLDVRGWPRQERKERVEELTALLQLDYLLERYPYNLSGGERQRVALGRALSFRPKIICLDEPLSALDEDTREEVIHFLKLVQKEVGVTALHVTHNRREANELADVHLHLVDGQVRVVESFERPGNLPVRPNSASPKPNGDGSSNAAPAPPLSAADCQQEEGGISSN